MAGHTGRRPQPTALKILRGNPGKRRLGDGEPQPELGVPEAPAILDEEARREWAWIAPELVKLGVLTKIDKWGLAAACLAWADYTVARQTGRRKHEAFLDLVRILGEFGLTPASRTRIKVLAPAAVSKLDQFRAKHG